MNDLEELLTDHLTQAAEAADLTPPPRERILDTAETRRRRRRSGYLMAVAAIAVVVAGLTAVVAAGTDRRDDTSPVLGGEDDPTGDPTGDPVTTPPPTETTTSLPTTTSTTEAPSSTADSLALTADGLGSIDFGTSMDDVVDAMTERLGQPTEDTGVVDLDCVVQCDDVNTDPRCVDLTRERRVEWTGISLTFLGNQETLFLTAWYTWSDDGGPDLATPEGVWITDPLDRWRDVYGDGFVTVPFQGQQVETIELTTASGPITGLTDPGDPPAGIDQMSAGYDCRNDGQ